MPAAFSRPKPAPSVRASFSRGPVSAAWEAAWQGLAPAVRVKRMENLLQLTMPGMLGERFRVLEGWEG